MKKFALIFALIFCSVLVSCSDDEEYSSCVVKDDCMPGYSCINSYCVPQSAQSDTDSADDADAQGNSDGNSSFEDGSDDGENTELPDGVQGCPNACSGFGDCNFETGECTCTQNHAGDDCSECIEGYHLESEDYDEDGDPNVRSCVINLTCDTNPCNNNTCQVQGQTVKCICSNHTAGTWCENCEDGYLKSTSGECKGDCSKVTCTPPQKCGIDFVKNEATCNACDNDHYSGEDCKSCDPSYFCNGHGKSCLVENNTPKCECETGYSGSDCKMCADGYFMSNGSCKKNCDPKKCFSPIYTCSGEFYGVPLTGYVEAHGTCNSVTGECDCEQGWYTGTSDAGVGDTLYCNTILTGIITLETLNNVECSKCDLDNPPAEYKSTGCKVACPGGFCDGSGSYFGDGSGNCYKEASGSHRLYCICVSGYTLSGSSKYYDENSTGTCQSNE